MTVSGVQTDRQTEMEVTMEVTAESGNDNRDPTLICSPVSTTDTNGNENIDEAGSEDSGMSSVDNHNLPGRHHVTHTDFISLSNQYGPTHNTPHTTQLTVNKVCSESVIPAEHHGLLMPTSPVSVTTASMSASDDMIENENEMMRDRVCALEKKVYDQNDEITCLRATLADCLRRINGLETTKSHVQISQPRLRSRDSSDSLQKTPIRRPISGSYSSQDFSSPISRLSHEAVNRRASYASNRDKLGNKSSIYTSSSSIHTDGSNSMSPAPSPSPTTPGLRGPVSSRVGHGGPLTPARPMSASLSGGLPGLHKKWSSTSDFRDVSPGPGQMSANRRHNPSGSLGKWSQLRTQQYDK